MHSIKKSITLMLMKVGLIKRTVFALIGAIAFLLIPQLATQAQAEEMYIFAYDKDQAGIIKEAIRSGNPAGLRNATIHAVGWGKQGQKYDFLLANGSEGYNKNTKIAKYRGEINCYGSGDESDQIMETHWFDVDIQLSENFDSKEKFTGKIVASTLTAIGRNCAPDGLSGRGGEKNIQILNATKGDVLDRFKARVGQRNSNDSNDSNDSGASPEEEAQNACTTEGGFGWVVCGLIKVFSEFVGFVETKLIAPMFEVDPLSFNTSSSDNPQYAAWNVMRSLANVFFVIVFMVVIFGNLFSIQAYNAKKILPKLIVAAILIQMSYVLMAAAIDVTNILGKGLRDIVVEIMPNIRYEAAGEAKIIGGFVMFGAATLITIALTAQIAAVGVFAAALPMVIGIAAVMLTLVLRQVLLVLLVLSAPIAIAAMALPNTENLFRKWMDLFIRLLLMYPLIILLFAAGRIAAISALSVNSTVVVQSIGPIVAMLCLALPLLAVPFTFSWAGGMMKKIGEVTTKAGSKASKGIQGSDWNKDRIEDRKNRALRAYNPNITGFSPKARWQNKIAGGGFLWNSAKARNRVGTAQNKLFDQDQKAVERQFENDTARSSFPQKKSLLTAIASGTAKGYRADAASRKFAIKKLAQYRDYETIRSMLAAPGGQQLYGDAVNSAYGDIDSAAPDITRGSGGFEALSSIKPGDFGDLDPTTIERYARGDNMGSGETLEQRHANIGAIFDSISSSPGLRSNFNRRALGTLKELADRGELGQHSSHIAGHMQYVSGSSALPAHADPSTRRDQAGVEYKRPDAYITGAPTAPGSGSGPTRPGSNTSGGTVTFTS